ncbi:facilitated trehalose transporter Tret1-like isoform X2 [Phymastichus coffea]|uniref:facilitated trehalose transporter Tret1-like isoform X2 n=1 Tax=Phymastichus coffea TaxID=108790 RepID=UPI00273B6AC3|nr:facilitated trehalose transporter Tret1-like isoform X2 [Phymastichus coffea]
MQQGVIGGMVSPMLAKLTSPDSPILLNSEEASWLASLANIARLFGAVIGSIACAYLGSKRSILLTCLPISVGWLATAFAKNVETLYAARVSNGIGTGMMFSTFPLYIGEIAMPSIRGALISFACCGFPIGQIVGSFATSYFDLTTSSLIYFGLCSIVVAILLLLPESPYYFIRVSNRKAAKKSISWYRADSGVEEELNAVEKFVATERSMSFIDKVKEFRKPVMRQAIYQVIVLFTFMQICGLNSIMSYMEIILRKAQCTILSPGEVVVYVNISATIANVISIFLIDNCGRKFLLIFSSAGLTVSMVSMSVHFALIDNNVNVINLQWIPIVSMVLFMAFFFLGLIPVPSAILSETIPSNIKSVASGIGSFTAGIMAFLSTKTFQPMVDGMVTVVDRFP